MWIVMIKSLRYYIPSKVKSLCIKKCHSLMKFRIPLLINNTKVIMSNEAYLEDSLMWFSFVWETLPK